MFQFIYAWLTAMYAALVGTGAILETAELRLAMDPVEGGGDAAEGDIVVPTFTGYLDAAIAAWTPAVDVNGVPYLTADPIVFSPTNDTNLPQYVSGAGILDANGDLVGYCNFEEPLLLSLPGQQLHVTPRVKFNDKNFLEIEAHVE